jgi:hypothetical protein
MIAMVGSSQISHRTKHIEVNFYYTRNKIANGTIQLEYSPTNKTIANGLIKGLTLQLFIRLRDELMFPRASPAHQAGVYVL